MDYREIRSTLVNKLNAAEDRSGNHIYFYLEIDKEDHIVGKLSHSFRGQALDYVISDTARRLKLSKKEFLNLVNCKTSKAQHEKLWRERDP
jgi:predicted RNA-binding protein (virulence factor B family)